ncbi:MAG: hypothetical protein NZ455_06255 [Bacteroidia bacterium]|nr:hypothetical protein [Bacteroidia bacterium]MDW8346185.1 hypothetical protein [Bacteroidia bacterium]
MRGFFIFTKRYFIFWACPSLRSGRAIPHCADARCYANAPHCLTACSIALTQAVCGCFTWFLHASLLYLI